MNSLSATAPIRMAALPKHYLQFTVRTYTKQMASTGLRCTGQWSANKYHQQPPTKRYISSTPQSQIKDYFPPPDAPKIKEVETAWAHPVYASPFVYINGKETNRETVIPKKKCIELLSATEKQRTGLTGLHLAVSGCCDGVWTWSQATNTLHQAKNTT